MAYGTGAKTALRGYSIGNRWVQVGHKSRKALQGSVLARPHLSGDDVGTSAKTQRETRPSQSVWRQM